MYIVFPVFTKWVMCFSIDFQSSHPQLSEHMHRLDVERDTSDVYMDLLGKIICMLHVCLNTKFTYVWDSSESDDGKDSGTSI